MQFQFFAPHVTAEQQRTFYFCAGAILVTSFVLALRTTTVIYSYIGGSDSRSFGIGGLVVLLGYFGLGRLARIQAFSALGIGFFCAVHFWGAVYSGAILGSLGPILSILLPAVGIIWILGNHPPTR